MEQNVRWKILVTVLLIGLVFYGVFSLQGVMQTYVTFSEAKKTNRIVRVAVFVDQKTRRYNPTNGALEFIAKDTNGEKLKVQFEGIPPAGFEQTPMAVVIGHYQDGVFKSNKMFIKCPSKYEGMKADKDK